MMKYFPHIDPSLNTSYHNDEWLSPRLEHILPQWWKISHTFTQAGTILPQFWTTLTQAETHPTTMMKYFHTFTQARTHPTTMMKAFRTYIHPGRNTSYHNDERACTYIHPGRNTSCSQWWKGSALTSDLVGTNPTVTLEWPLVLLD